MDFKNLLIAITGGLASSIVTLLFSFKQFSSQRWWERKSDEYLRIINQLVDYQNCAYKWQDHMWSSTANDSSGLSKEETDRLFREDKELRESVRKTAMAGSFLISAEASGALTKMLEQTNEIETEDDDPLNKIDHLYKLLKDTVATVRECAKADLNVK